MIIITLVTQFNKPDQKEKFCTDGKFDNFKIFKYILTDFTEFDRGDMSEIGKVIIYVMSFKVAQSDTERCGSKLKVIFLFFRD